MALSVIPPVADDSGKDAYASEMLVFNAILVSEFDVMCFIVAYVSGSFYQLPDFLVTDILLDTNDAKKIRP